MTPSFRVFLLVLGIVTVCLATVNAFAAPVAQAVTPDGRLSITLHDDAGGCVDGALRAVFMSVEPERVRTVQGCWRLGPGEDGPVVTAVFLDATAGQVPAAAFKEPKSL